MLADYWVLRRRRLDVDALFDGAPGSAYHYTRGYNLRALLALAAGVAPNVPGFLSVAGILAGVPALWVRVYDYAWFVGFGVAAALHVALMAPRRGAQAAAS